MTLSYKIMEKDYPCIFAKFLIGLLIYLPKYIYMATSGTAE